MSMQKIIINIISGIVQGFATSFIIYEQIKIIKIQKKRILFLGTLLSLSAIISLLFIGNQFRFVYALFSFAVIISITLKYRKSVAIVYSFNTEIILAFSEIIVSLLLVIIGINSKQIVTSVLYNLLANILISMFAVIMMLIPFIKKIIDKINELFIKNKKLLNILFIFISIIYIVVLKNGFEFLLRANYYINFLFIIGIAIILTIFIKNEFKTEQLQEQNQQMLNYVTKYEKIITEQGKVNHEFKNQLMVIKGYAQMNSEKLIKYLDLITKDFNKTTSSYLISQLNKFPDGGIKGLLYYKLSIMEDEKINYEIDIESGVKTKLKKVDIETYKNITKVLGVLLDNAIESSKKSKEKNIIILVSKDNKDVIFSISNTYKGKIDIDKFGTGYTTKGKGHGYGLRLVNDIVESDKTLILEKEIDSGYYTTKLIININ